MNMPKRPAKKREFASAPVNVRLLRVNGEQVPLEFIPLEVDEDGQQPWKCIRDVVAEEGDEIVYDGMPENTYVIVDRV
jgi:hypothetical protein